MNALWNFGILVVLSCFLLEARCRPSNNESTAQIVEETTEETEEQLADQVLENNERDIRTLDDQIKLAYIQGDGETTREILEKIKSVNEGLKKPQRQKIKYSKQPDVPSGIVLDKTILEKIQQIIAAGKPNGISGPQKVFINDDSDSNSLTDNGLRSENARALPYIQQALTNNALSGNQATTSYGSLPYLTSLPVLVVPSTDGIYGGSNNGFNSLNSNYGTRQSPTFPSLPFQVPWPLAPFFPILVKDPLLHYLHGGSWENLLEYGQSADVCNRKQKSSEDKYEQDINSIEDEGTEETISLNLKNTNSRQGRKLKKRTVAKSTPVQDLETLKEVQKLFNKKPFAPVKPTKPQEPIENTKTPLSDYSDGDLRFPFGDFTWFGNRKPVAPSPGFFINRLKVRKGGVAIAGPGGVATAGRGGTAVVGPGGLAYTQPGGLAVAGPAAKVVALSSDADLNSVITRLQQQSATDGSVPRLLQAIPEGRIVATGPVIYYHPYNTR